MVLTPTDPPVDGIQEDIYDIPDDGKSVICSVLYENYIALIPYFLFSATRKLQLTS